MQIYVRLCVGVHMCCALVGTKPGWPRLHHRERRVLPGVSCPARSVITPLSSCYWCSVIVPPDQAITSSVSRHRRARWETQSSWKINKASSVWAVSPSDLPGFPPARPQDALLFFVVPLGHFQLVFFLFVFLILFNVILPYFNFFGIIEHQHFVRTECNKMTLYISRLLPTCTFFQLSS